MRILVSLALLSAMCVPALAAVVPGDCTFIKVRNQAEASGTGPVARNAAIQNAERAAVSETLEKAFQAKNLPYLARLVDAHSRYIRSTQLRRFENRDASTWVEIESYVERDALLKDAAKALLPQLTLPPTVLVMVADQSEEGGPTPAAPGAAEKALVKSLTENHFVAADVELVRRLNGCDEGALAERVAGDESAAQLARQEFADVCIFGTAATVSESKGGNIFANSARVELRVFRSDGKFIDSLAQEAVVHSANAAEGAAAAVEDACSKMAGELLVTAALAAAGVERTDDILMTVEGAGNRVRFEQLIETVNSAAGSNVARELFYSDALARVRVAYRGPLGPFVDTITKGRYGGSSVEVITAVERIVQMRFTEPE